MSICKITSQAYTIVLSYTVQLRRFIKIYVWTQGKWTHEFGSKSLWPSVQDWYVTYDKYVLQNAKTGSLAD